MGESLLDALQRKYNAYVDEFRVDGALPPLMRLKREHTAFVLANAHAIAMGEGFDEKTRRVCEAAALLHDTGRYEQLKRYNTFRDADSVDHAVFSHDIVKEKNWLADVSQDERDAILAAVLYHNRRDLPDGLDPLTAAAAMTVRDADKLDIFRVLEHQVATTDWRKDSAAFWNLPLSAPPSTEVVDAIKERRPVDYQHIRSLADFVLIQVGWMISGLYYATTRRLTGERGHLQFRRNFLHQLVDSPEIDLICDMAAGGQIELAQFLWGTRDEVRGAERRDLPQFRLVNDEGGMPCASQMFSAESAHDVHRICDSTGRAVGTVWSDDDADWCFLAGVEPADILAPRGEQAASVFLQLEAYLAKAGMTFADVVRTWLYIDRVCEWYGEFNAARSSFFEKRNVFNTFLPASTGIGSANLEGAAIVSGAIAMRPKREGVRAELVDSPLQAPAMAYKSSFSRAAEIIGSKRRCLFVSGTASIKPNSHDVAYIGDIDRQIDCTMNAVEAILKSRGLDWKDVSRAIVYLKGPGFAAAWRAWLAARGLPQGFAVETVCDVCRDEWLFEIECDAVSRQ